MKKATAFCCVLIIATLFSLAFPITSYASTIAEEQTTSPQKTPAENELLNYRSETTMEELFANSAKLTTTNDEILGLESMIPAEHLESAQTN